MRPNTSFAGALVPIGLSAVVGLAVACSSSLGPAQAPAATTSTNADIDAGGAPLATGGTQPPPPPAAPAKRPQSTLMSAEGLEEAIDQAGRAMCDRERSCDQIGPNRTYRSEEACRLDKRLIIQSSAPVTSCPSTIAADRLRACFDALRVAECAPPGKPLPPQVECSRATLCARDRQRDVGPRGTGL